MRPALALAAALLALSGPPAIAHHPSDRIDEVMAEREPAFEATDLRRASALDLEAPDAGTLRLSGLGEQIVVLSFLPEGCGAPCEAQQALLRRVQEGVNVTPMREMVTFVTVAAPDVPAGAWDAGNWRRLTPTADNVADAAARFRTVSARDGDGPAIHVVDRGGRHSALFHGAAFAPVDVILYVNELSRMPPAEPGLLDRLVEPFR